MVTRRSRDEMGIGKDTAPYHGSFSTIIRINKLLEDCAGAFYEKDFESWKDFLDLLYLDASITTTRAGNDKKVEKHLQSIKELKPVVREELNHYLQREDDEGLLVVSNIKDLLYEYQALIMMVLDEKGLLIAKIDTGEDAFMEKT